MRLHSLFILILSIIFAATPVWAVEVVSHGNVNQHELFQWDVIDIRFDVTELPATPTTTEFSATFVSQRNGVRQKCSGFYDGGHRFVLRFTPPAPGDWTYVTVSTETELNGKQGHLVVRPPRVGRKGGIELGEKNLTRFQYANGDSYYPIAFESDWLFALDAENSKDIPRTRSLVDTLAANGFNQVVMNVFAFDVNWPKDSELKSGYEFGSPRVFPFGGDNQHPDHTRLNIEYFQRLDRVIDYLDQKGIVAHLMIYVWNKRVNWPRANSESDNRYFDYVVKRYQAFPNLVWDVSKEALGYGHNDVDYITDRIQRLRERDDYGRLITVHDYGYCRRFTDQVDFVSVQLWSSELYGVMRKVCEQMPGKPIVNIEHGGYERGPYVVFTGNYTSPETCLERAWRCVFAGTYPTHYWQGAAWNVVISDVSDLSPEDQPRLDYYRHMRDFVERYQVGQLIAGETKSNAGFCLHNGNDLYLYLVPEECEFLGVRMPEKARGKTMNGRWFNPFDNSLSEPETQEISQWPAFKVPAGDGFRILVVEIK